MSRREEKAPVAHMNADLTEETSYEVLRQTTRTVRTTQQVSETIMGTDMPYLIVGGPDIALSRHYSAWSSGSSFASSAHRPYWPQDHAASVSKALPEPSHTGLPPLIVTLRHLDDPRAFTLPLDQQHSPKYSSRVPASPSAAAEVSEVPAPSDYASRLPSVHFLLHGCQKPLPSPPETGSNLLSLGSTYVPFARDLAKHAISTTASASEYAHLADRSRSRSNALPLSSAYTIKHSTKASAPTVSHTQGHSQSLMWITETTEDELGKTSITSFVNEVGSPDGSRADLKRKAPEKWEVWIQEYSDMPPPTKRLIQATSEGKRIPSHMRRNLPCESCGTTETCQWRRGPKGTTTLCNACGLCYARNIAKPPKSKGTGKTTAPPGQSASMT